MAAPKVIEIANKTRGNVVAARVTVADTAVRRIVGLLRHTGLGADEGLLISPCNSIHSIGMKFIFDAVFLDKQNRVVYVIESMKPWRLSKLVFGAKSVLELPGVAVARNGLQLGDELKLA